MLKTATQVEQVFITRAAAAQRIGCYEARQIAIWKRKGHPLPKGFKPAIRVDGVVYPARSGETLHADIVNRVQVLGGTVEDGFCYDAH